MIVPKRANPESRNQNQHTCLPQPPSLRLYAVTELISPFFPDGRLYIVCEKNNEGGVTGYSPSVDCKKSRFLGAVKGRQQLMF
jgi:hypothetical protein